MKNSIIVFAFLSGLFAYNYRCFVATFDDPLVQNIVGILTVLAAVIGLLTLIRMNIIFKTGYGQYQKAISTLEKIDLSSSYRGNLRLGWLH